MLKTQNCDNSSFQYLVTHYVKQFMAANSKMTLLSLSVYFNIDFILFYLVKAQIENDYKIALTQLRV